MQFLQIGHASSVVEYQQVKCFDFLYLEVNHLTWAYVFGQLLGRVTGVNYKHVDLLMFLAENPSLLENNDIVYCCLDF